MQMTTIKMSDVGNRLDAGFHIARSRVADRAQALREAETAAHAGDGASAEEAVVGRLLALPLEALKATAPLTRGEGARGTRCYERAVREYPWLAYALIEREAGALAQRLEEDARKVAALAASLRAVAATPR